MTLHEQYKERISNCKKERNCKDEYCTSCYADEYIKQSFLDSIDCMIAMLERGSKIVIKSELADELKATQSEVNAIPYVDGFMKDIVIYLKQQRELIANEN